MGKMVRKFDILISCPSDIQEELNVIREVVDNFNATIGDANNTFLYIKHWTTHSYTESGGTPQDLLNNQIVLDSDAVIAVFWTRFGSPTQNFGSGTEEEIELLLNEGKQIFMFFSDISAPPSKQIPEQYKKITEFKDSYRNKGIYKSYESMEEFKKMLTNDLTQYFLKKSMETSNKLDSPSPNEAPNLSVKSIKGNSLIDNLEYFKYNLTNSNFIADKNQEIKSIIQKIDSFNLSIVDERKVYRMKSDVDVPLEVKDALNSIKDKDEPNTELTKSLVGLLERRKIIITQREKKLVSDFLKEEDINIDSEQFFNIGNLTTSKNLFQVNLFNTGPSYTYDGTDEEKEKYKLLKSLFRKLEEYKCWLAYFIEIDSKTHISLAISNSGKVYDEDVDVKLYIDKGALIKNKDIPMPDPSLIEEAIEQLYLFYEIRSTHKIEEYDDGLINSPHNFIDNTPDILGRTIKKDDDELKEDFLRVIDGIFNFQYYEDKDFDIISFNIKYIKKNTNIAFPSVLMFNSEVNEINYEINSKYSSELFKGSLKLN